MPNITTNHAITYTNQRQGSWIGNFAQYTVFPVGKQTNLHQGPEKLRETFASEITITCQAFLAPLILR